MHEEPLPTTSQRHVLISDDLTPAIRQRYRQYQLVERCTASHRRYQTRTAIFRSGGGFVGTEEVSWDGTRSLRVLTLDFFSNRGDTRPC